MSLSLYLLGAVIVLTVVYNVKEWATRPKNLPPVYTEFPYLPWIGSIVQFAIQPREFLQRAHAAMGDIFTINLFGWSITFLMSSDGEFGLVVGQNVRDGASCQVPGVSGGRGGRVGHTYTFSLANARVHSLHFRTFMCSSS
jgi:hypothetical protein